ncbi:S-adenosyl-L-methionine-dependent methyltransferase [Naviculisporaceae sp. PSN 640]
MSASIPTTTPELASEALASWEANATYWDAAMGLEGNKYWKVLQVPCLERMLGDKYNSREGFTALELATGNGLAARWLAQHGASSVLATDAAEGMLKIAEGYLDKESGEFGKGKIKFRRLDITRDEDFEALLVESGGGFTGYDVILINMAIMDIATLDPLARALPKLLSKDGVFIATILHPLFFTSDASRSVSQHFNLQTGELETVRSVIVREYLNVPPAKGIAIPGQPVKQLYFHRPIHQLFGDFLNKGELVLDRVEEPAFGEEHRNTQRVESSVNFLGVPALLAFRLRRRI